LKIQELPIVDVDVFMGMFMGADFLRVSVGTQGVTSKNQLVTILGYSSSTMTGELSDEELKKHSMSQEFTDVKQRLIGLFYDKNSKDRQEIIDLPPFDVRPVISLDDDVTLKLAKESLLMDAEVAKNLINIMVEPNSTSLQRSQLNAQILKALSLMLSVLKQDYIDFLHKNDLLSKFVNFLQLNSQKSQQKATA